MPERHGKSDLTAYLLGERSELRPLIEAIAKAHDTGSQERAAAEYLLVLAAARQAASGQPPEQRAMVQVRNQYNRVFTRDTSEHGRTLKELYLALKRGDGSDAVAMLKLLGLYHRRRGSYRLALASFGVASELVKPLNDPLEELNTLFWLGVTHRYLGDLDRAEAVHREQLELAREVDQRGQAVLAMENIGLVTLRRGGIAEARNLIIRALTEAQELDDRELQGYCYHALMVVEMEDHRPGEAAACGWEAYSRYESADQRLRALRDCGSLLFDAGLYDAAEAAYELVLDQARDVVPRIHARGGMAEVAAARGDETGFEELADLLLAEEGLEELTYERIKIHRTLGVGYSVFGNLHRARHSLERALHDAEKNGFAAEAEQISGVLANLPEAGSAFRPLHAPEEEFAQLRTVGQKIIEERARKCA